MKLRNYEVIFRWSQNRADIEYQRLLFVAPNFVEAAKKGFRIVKLLNSVGGYPPNSAAVVAVAEYNTLAKWQEETRVPIIRNKTEQNAAVAKIMQAAKVNKGKVQKIKPVTVTEPAQTIRTRIG